MVIPYDKYHAESMAAKDVDPSVICLKYLAERFELNTEQRYWIAFLYGTCYCAPTTFYIYNEFPDFEGVDVTRLSKWWDANKYKLIFQTDRQRIKSNNQFVDSFKSYKALVGRGTQQGYFQCDDWTQVYKKIEAIKYFGRFALFNYLDVLNQITDIRHKPPYLNMVEAESCRKGLAYAIGRDDLVEAPLSKATATLLHKEFVQLLASGIGNVFQIETTLCAYKKYRRGKRYIGFYIDRMGKEIEKISALVNKGVCWEVLWQFRNETFEHKYLYEKRK